MKIEHICIGDILVNTDARGTGYYQVRKINRVTVDVLHESGRPGRMSAHLFDRKVNYVPAAFEIIPGFGPQRRGDDL